MADNLLRDLLRGSNNPCCGSVEVTFAYHQRYENGNAVLGEQHHQRTLRIEKNISGNIGYTVSINPSMGPKRMKIIGVNDDTVELRGYGYDENAVMMGIPRNMASFESYALSLRVSNHAIVECTLHLLDRNVDIRYYQYSGEINAIYRKDFTFISDSYEEWQLYPGKLINSGATNTFVCCRVEDDILHFNLVNKENHIDIANSFEFLSFGEGSGEILQDGRIQYTKFQLDFNFDPIVPMVCEIFRKEGFVYCIRLAMTNPDRVIEFYGHFSE